MKNDIHNKPADLGRRLIPLFTYCPTATAINDNKNISKFHIKFNNDIEDQ